MTILISVIGFVVRFASALLTTALGWASSLLFGRVQRSHQIFVILMLAGSLTWMFFIIGALWPGVPGYLFDATPHPGFIDRTWLRDRHLGRPGPAAARRRPGRLPRPDRRRPAVGSPDPARAAARLHPDPGPRRPAAVPAGRRHLAQGPQRPPRLVGRPRPDRRQAQGLRPDGRRTCSTRWRASGWQVEAEEAPAVLSLPRLGADQDRREATSASSGRTVSSS